MKIIISLWAYPLATFIYFLTSKCVAALMPDVRVLILTGLTPRDGNLRLFRSANSRGLLPEFIHIGVNDMELENIVTHINENPGENTDLLIITSSDSMVMTKEKAFLIHEVANVVLNGQGTVAMAFPSNYTADEPTDYDEEIEEVYNKLKKYFKPHQHTPHIKTMDDWEFSAPLFGKYRSLLVKKKQINKRDGRILSSKFCAFAGITPAIKQLFHQVLSGNLTKENGTLNRLCYKSVIDAKFRRELGIVLDWHSEIFKLGHPVDQNSIGVTPIADGSRVASSSETEFAPVTLGRPWELPYFLSNFMTGEIGIRHDCERCPDKPINDFAEIFPEEEGYPTLHLLVARKSPVYSYEEFLESISSLDYPKSKIQLTFIISIRTGEENLMSTIKEYFEEKSYASFTGLSASDVSIAYLFMELGQRALDVETDYVFMVDPQAIFTNPQTLKNLIRANKRFIAPMLVSNEGDWNFRSQLNGDVLENDILTDYVTNRHVSDSVMGKGLLQVPYLFGAVMMKRNILKSISSPFKLDDVCMKDLNRADCKVEFHPQWKQPEKIFWSIFSRTLIKKGFILYVTNEEIFGRLQKPGSGTIQ